MTSANPSEAPDITHAGALVKAAVDESLADDYITYEVLAAINGSSLVGFTSSGAGAIARTVQDKCWEHLSALDFGAVGDGTTDNTAALMAADAAAASLGKALHLPAGTYICGPLSVSAPWVGEGRENTIIKRLSTAPTMSFLTASGTSFSLSRLTIDGNRSANSNGCHNIYCGSGVSEINLKDVCSRNARANQGWGTGAYIEGGAEAIGSTISDCLFTTNDSDGLSISNISNLVITGSTFYANTGNGAWINNYDQTFVQKLLFCRISDNHFTTNSAAGLVLGNFVQNNNFNQPIYDIGNPEANYCTVTGNSSTGNGSYGFDLSGWAIAAVGNVSYNNAVSTPSAAGILFNCTYGLLNSNVVYKNQGGFGIDAGGAQACGIQGNVITWNAGVGLNLEGGPFAKVSGNFFYHNSTDSQGEQLSLSRYGAGGYVQGFTTISSGVDIDNNYFLLDATRIGIYVHDNPDSVSVRNNRFFCSSNISQCIYAIGVGISFAGNKLLNTGSSGLTVSSSGVLEIPDVLEDVYVNSSTTVSDLRTSSMRLVGSGIGYCTLVSGGSGYTSQPSVTFSGGGGSGAQAISVISASGAVTGIKMVTYGTGYSSTPSVVFSGGGGTGASATAQWKLGVPEQRRLSVLCLQSETLTRAGAAVIENPALADIKVPANGVVELIGYFGQWYLKGKNF
jgi:hypothetical protein